MLNLARLTEQEQEAVNDAERYLVYTEMAADAGADPWLYHGRMCARHVLELAQALDDARA